MTDFLSLHEAVATRVRPGMAIALEGFTHLIPFGLGHEIIRQGVGELTLIRMTPDIVYDQLVGMGLARQLVFSWGGNAGAGSLHRIREAVEKGWPRPVALDEHSHAGMAARFSAGAAGMPVGLLRGYRGTDLLEHTDTVREVACPFTGERLAAVRALNPDVTGVHAQLADRAGNVMMWGVIGAQKEAVLAARTVIVSVEQIVDALPVRPAATVLPYWVVDVVVELPNGTHPSYAAGFGTRDNQFYQAWGAVSGDRERFMQWIDRHVISVDDPTQYLRTLDDAAGRPPTGRSGR